MASGKRFNPLGWALTTLVRGYQLIVSPWFAPQCRYYPSCSAYALSALRRHGPLTAMVLASWRLLRCNPWSAGGVDPVPEPGHLPWQEAWRRRGAAKAHHEEHRTPSNNIAWSAGHRPDHS